MFNVEMARMRNERLQKKIMFREKIGGKGYSGGRGKE